jgi:DNA-directed RNA polymerase subunit omega
MSRITISDALEHFDSKYELTMLASQRVRDLNGGEIAKIPVGDDKPTVTALREMSHGLVDANTLRDEYIQTHRRPVVASEDDANFEIVETVPELKELDEELSGLTAKKEELAEIISDESEGTETLESIEDGDGAVDVIEE